MNTHLQVKGFVTRLLVSSLAILCLALSLFSYLVLETFEDAFTPEVEKKAALIAQKVSQDVNRAIGYEIPLEKLSAMESYLDGFVKNNKDVEAIRIKTKQGQILFASSQPHRSSVPVVGLEIKQQDKSIAVVEIFAEPDYLDSHLTEMVYDLGTTVLISLLVAFELLSFFVFGRVIGPLSLFQKIFSQGGTGDFTRTLHCRATKELVRIESTINGFLYNLSEHRRDIFDVARDIRAAQITETIKVEIDGLLEAFSNKVKTGKPYGFQDISDDNIRVIRFPLFMFMCAEELSRPFLPMLAQQYQNVTWLVDQQKLASALPIAVFMGMIVIVSLISGYWLEKWGGKKLFLFGVLPAVIGYVGVFFAWDYISFLAARAISAFGYAVVFVASQGYVASCSTSENRAANMSVFIGGVLVAGICGPAIGGILASQIGYHMTFAVSAIFVILAMLCLVFFLGEDRIEKYQGPVDRRSDLSFTIFSNKAFSLITFFCAIPAKITLTAVIYLLTPLYLIELEYSEATIGRVMMLYGVLVILIMPRLSQLSDRKGWHVRMVILGSIMAGVGAMTFFVFQGLWASVTAVAFIGAGQALSMPTQLAQVQHVFNRDDANFSIASALGVFRCVERLGSVLGPLLGGALAIAYGIETAIALIGVIGLVCALIYSLTVLIIKDEA